MGNARSVEQLKGEIRYSERLCQRTARLYRHLQTWATALGVLGGSGTLAALIPHVPGWIPPAGAVLLAGVGAVVLAVRPGDKAAMNEADMRRYALLMSSAQSMSAGELERALEQARPSDAPEVELLRNVAFNDVVREIGRPDAVVTLSRAERLVAALA